MNKRSKLLDEEEGMIEMQDFHQYNKFYMEEKEEDLAYLKFQDRPSFGKIKCESTSQHLDKTQYHYPTHSIHTAPNQITMNGYTFRMEEKAPKRKKAKLPKMSVTCQNCHSQQRISGNSFFFQCCECRFKNQCTPVYGIFICGDCQAYVCYQYHTSELIKCTKCNTINKVPIAPQKKFIHFKNQIKKHIKNKKNKEVKFIPPEENDAELFEFEDEFFDLEKIKKQNKSQELLDDFEDDFPALSNEKQMKYPNL